MNIISADIFFTNYASLEQEKYRELKSRELKSRELKSRENENDNNKSFVEIFSLFYDELKTSTNPYEAIINSNNKLYNKSKKNKTHNLYNYRVSYD